MKEFLKKRILSIIDILIDLYWRLGRLFKSDSNRTEKLQKITKKIPLLTRFLSRLKTDLFHLPRR